MFGGIPTDVSCERRNSTASTEDFPKVRVSSCSKPNIMRNVSWLLTSNVLWGGGEGGGVGTAGGVGRERGRGRVKVCEEGGVVWLWVWGVEGGWGERVRGGRA